MRKRLNQAGFTVYEMIVACVVASVLLIGVMTFMTNTLVNNNISTTRADLLREAQLTLDLISKDMRLSANVDVLNRWQDNNSPDAATTNGYGWVAGGDVLILATAAEDQSNNIIFQDVTNYVTYKNNNIYFVSGGNLYKRTLAAPVANNDATTTCPASQASGTCPADRMLVSNVSGFSLRYLNNLDEEVEPAQARSVEVTLSLSKEKYNRTIDAQYVTRTVFRNE